MFKEINEEILKLKERLREKKKLETLKEKTEEELLKKKAQKQELKKILQKEGKDVEKLENISISSVFLSLTGKKEEKLNKEKEEHLIAKLKYENCMNQINELENQLEDANKLLINYKEVNKNYNDLVKEKEELLIKAGGVSGNKLKNELLPLLSEKPRISIVG